MENGEPPLKEHFLGQLSFVFPFLQMPILLMIKNPFETNKGLSSKFLFFHDKDLSDMVTVITIKIMPFHTI